MLGINMHITLCEPLSIVGTSEDLAVEFIPDYIHVFALFPEHSLKVSSTRRWMWKKS